MYTIIDNYLYDTEKSQYIYGSIYKIFKTKNGRFFQTSRTYNGLICFEIISEAKVRNTLHNDIELYTKHFGKPLEA